MPLAIAVIFGIAIIPGYLNANLIASLLIDRPPPLRFDLVFPEVTVVIACFNEEKTIEETLDYVVEQDYPGSFGSWSPTTAPPTAPPSWRARVPRPTPTSPSSPSPTAARPRP